MEAAGPSRETFVSTRLNGAELLVKEVITRVDEFKKNAEKVDNSIKYLKQKVIETKNCKQEFFTKIDIIESSKELLYVGEKMQDLTLKSIAKLQVHADRMIQILSFLNRTDDSGRKMIEIEREATRKRWVKKTANRRSIIDEFKSKEKLAISRVNEETYMMDADSSEDEVWTRKTIEQSPHSQIAGTEVSHLVNKRISKHAEVLDSTFVKEDSVQKQTTKFRKHKALSKTGSKREFLALDGISRQKKSCENEDTELTMRKNESISAAPSKMQQSEVTTSVKAIEEFPFQKHDLTSIRKKTAVNKRNHVTEEACDFVGDKQRIKSVCGNTAKIFDGCMKKTPRKRMSAKENDAGSYKSKILVLDKNFKVPEQNELSQRDNEREFSILDCTELSLPSPVLHSQKDSLKGKQKFMKGKYTTAQRWYSIADSQNSKERFFTESKSRGQTVEMGQNRRSTAEMKFTEVGEMSKVSRSESEKTITDESNNKQKNKATSMVFKGRRIREIMESEEEESEVANDSNDGICLYSSKGIYANDRDTRVSKEKSRKPKKLPKNGVNNYFNRSESDSIVNENQGIIKSELDLAEQNIFGMCSDKLMERENILPSVQGKPLQNRRTRQCRRTIAEADEPMLLEEKNVSLNNYTGNMAATNVQQEDITESSRSNNHSQKIMEKPSFDESTDSPINETVDFPDIYTSWHRILEQFIEIQSHNSTYLEHLEAVFEHVSDIYGILDMDNSEDQPRGLSEAQINCLPISQYSKQHDNNTERWSFKDTKCSICLSQYVYGELLRNLPCLHAFHVNCVDKWLERSNTCPTCRRVV